MAVHAGWLDGPKLHLASSCLSGPKTKNIRELTK